MEVPGAVGRPGFIEGASSGRIQQLFGCSVLNIFNQIALLLKKS